MSTPTTGSLITPLEPHGARAVAAVPSVGQQSVCATAFGRIEAAVASSCGSHHDTNEDAHTTLRDSTRMFVVADGVGGGAMAQMASRQLVSHLHQALDAHRLNARRVRAAMLDADRAIAQRIAQVTDSPGAATVALCAPVNVFASKWLVAWVGDCRVLRLAMRGEAGIELLTRDDTFRHLNETPPAGGSLDWCRVLKQQVPLAQRCEELIALARINGTTDDATVLLLQRACFGEPRAGWIKGLVGSIKSKGPKQ